MSSSVDVLEAIKSHEENEASGGAQVSVEKLQVTVDALRAAVDGLEQHNRQLMDKHSEATQGRPELQNRYR